MKALSSGTSCSQVFCTEAVLNFPRKIPEDHFWPSCFLLKRTFTCFPGNFLKILCLYYARLPTLFVGISVLQPITYFLRFIWYSSIIAGIILKFLGVELFVILLALCYTKNYTQSFAIFYNYVFSIWTNDIYLPSFGHCLRMDDFKCFWFFQLNSSEAVLHRYSYKKLFYFL